MNDSQIVMAAWKAVVAERLIEESKCEWCTHLRDVAIGTTMEQVCPEHKAKRVMATFHNRYA